ncbi:hypothetical protein [Archaeoglobus neptunius]|uniref:hypothetical protein n=1 Tax=Archaeoglobus neptunius TaxID=2798580 RepID=UPI00192583C3|nr:hypothetical protein [Archaeoglobus neptunius]
MPVRGSYSHGLKEILDILGRDPYTERALKLVLEYSGEGTIPADKLDEEVALTLDYYRLAVPVNSVYGSLSWKMRLFSVSSMEIPYIIRYFFEDLQNGKAEWRSAVVRYFKDIGETEPEEFAEIFEEIVKKGRNLIICGEDIVDISMRFGRDGGVVIAELKGAGLISPSVGCGGFGRFRAPLYEINRFFALLVENHFKTLSN